MSRSVRILLGLAVDLLGAGVAIPLAVVVILGNLLATTEGKSCPSPCDGPFLLGLGIAAIVVLVFWAAYAALSIRKGRTPGMTLFRVGRKPR